ncbi:MAG: restriction endonuclease subunit S [Methyloprofundus sp.]|nr:restriction endonuclease subunit S [Methyloprofundus sp.]
MLNQLITNNIELWTSAETSRSTAGRGSNGKTELTGIKKLRELILELAVRGLLVPQDPSDEPASVLLEKIAAEKEALIKAGKIKKQKPLPEIAEDEKPFDLPNGWEFERFIKTLDFSGGSQPPKHTFSEINLEGYVQLIQIRDLGPNPQPVYIPKDKASKFCTENDVMIGRYGASVGKVFWGKNGAYNVALIKLHNDHEAYTQGFLYLIMKSPLGQSFFNGMSRSAQAGFSKDDIANKILPVIPLPEQHRIVAKVDELMALCDQLEQQQLEHSDTHHTLVTTLLDSLCQAVDNDQFQSIWSQLAANFDTLFTNEASIDQLKQTLLQLAVMGKLVPQDPNDEPASVLLEKIAAEKAALIKAGKIKKQKPLPEIADDEKPFNLPEGWEWARLIDCYDVRDGTHDSPKYTAEGYPLVTSKNLSSGKLDFSDIKFISETDHKKIIERSRVDAGDILFAMIGSIGNPAIVDTEREFSIKNVALFKYYKKSLSAPHFLLKFLMFAENVFKEQSSGAVQSFVSLGKVRSFPLALPPLPEQHRIVAKVDELMALCDQLKAGLNQAQTTQQQLAHTIVQQAVA